MKIKDIKVLVACEESQTVTKAFRRLGVNAFSCDLQECSGGHPEWHFKDDAIKIMNSENWTLLIAHPPCTFSSAAGYDAYNIEKYGKKAIERRRKLFESYNFFMCFANSKIKYKCIENPVGLFCSMYKKPDQIIQPWMFGHQEEKRTCLWLYNLPLLIPTKIRKDIIKSWVANTHGRNKEETSKLRSKTFDGVGEAMATQWLPWILEEKEDNRIKIEI